MRCEDCKWFKGKEAPFFSGSCHKGPPVSLQTTNYGATGNYPGVWHGWPEVANDDFCGAFEISGKGSVAQANRRRAELADEA
ncbi:MAG: hypothetical protein C5B44_01405, partial [Acidobacteria bacterium]